ncbi:MAG: hypothetical protein U1E27_03485 [Kiritimatiellia bacterium]|nr:hypothetical protein [Kiritimatiellia bacterium]
MEQVEIFLVFTKRLEQIGVNYMATGSVASMLYGLPRFTHDLDLVMDLPPSQIQGMTEAFPLTEFYCPPPEVLKIESGRSRRGHFNIIHHSTGFKADVYLHGSDELQAWGLSKKQRVDLSDGNGIWTAPPEYVIVRKLEYYREGHSEKHLLDIRGMLEISRDLIDDARIQTWVERLDLQAQWKAAQIPDPRSSP